MSEGAAREWVAALAVFRSLYGAGHVTPATKRVLDERMAPPAAPRFFSARELTRLRAAARRLVPHDPARIDLAAAVDARLADGRGKGWRYAATPPDPVAYRELLAALPGGFEDLSASEQDAELRLLQRSHTPTFTDLLDELASNYYAHPLVQLSIGSLSFADAPRWTQLGLGELEAREQAAREALSSAALGRNGVE